MEWPFPPRDLRIRYNDVTGRRPGQGEQQPKLHSAASAARWKRQNGPRSVMYSNVHVVVSVVIVVEVEH